MAFSAKALPSLSFFHFVLGVLAFITGLVSMNFSPFYNGVFGMGLWIGGWMILTSLAGFLSSRHPGDYCKIGLFLGSCLVAVVILSVCSIILGTVVITHYQFESMVTRSYYKDKGTFGQVAHDDYFKPDAYFESRRKEGRIGLAVYGSLLAIQIGDLLVCCLSIYVCRDLCRTEEGANNEATGRRAQSTRRSADNPNPDVPIVPLAPDGNNWTELGFPSLPQTIQYYSPCKLPNYGELYPEGIVNTGQDRLELQPRSPDEPPPEYTPTVAPSSPQLTSLPGSSVDLPSTPCNLLAEDRIDQSRARFASSLEEHSLVSGPPPEYPGTLRLPSLAPPLDPGDSSGPCSPHGTPSDTTTSESETNTTDAEGLERDLPSCSTPSSVPPPSLRSEVRTLPNTVTRSSTETFDTTCVLNIEHDNDAENVSTNSSAVL